MDNNIISDRINFSVHYRSVYFQGDKSDLAYDKQQRDNNECYNEHVRESSSRSYCNDSYYDCCCVSSYENVFDGFWVI